MSPYRKAPVSALVASALFPFFLTACQDAERMPEPTGISASVSAAEPTLSDDFGPVTAGGSHEVVVTQANNVQSTKTTFENGGNGAEIHPEAGNLISGTPMRFPSWRTVIDSDVPGGTASFANEPSPSTIAFWICSATFPCAQPVPTTFREILFDHPVSGVSFFYASFPAITLEVFDAGSNLLATAAGLGNVAPPVVGDPTGVFDTWTLLSVDVGANLITRAKITGNQNQTGIDDFTVTEVFIEVTIDIKPGSDPNSINPKSKGEIPVAILSAADFDAPATVDATSLTFGRTGDELSLAFCNTEGEDVNGDGRLDLVCHFFTQKTGFAAEDTEGILRGQTTGGQPVEGRDPVRIIK